jgi:hypothetical protein
MKGEMMTGKTEELRKTHPSSTLSSAEPTWTVLGAKPGLHVRKPTTNCLSYSKSKKEADSKYKEAKILQGKKLDSFNIRKYKCARSICNSIFC